jgi:hypothetical protein
MITDHSKSINNYLTQELKQFSETTNLAFIIIDPYFGGKSMAKLNIEGFIDFINKLVNQSKFIWFFNKRKCTPMAHQQVELIDLYKYGIDIHDRFLILFDGQIKKYIHFFHLGGSINGFDINSNDPLAIMRISTLEQIEVQEIQKLIQQLEKIYLRETAKSNWGCLD